MPTNTLLHYLNDTYVDSGEGVVLDVGRDDRGPYIVLNQTIFYPQGGGQPCDVGSIQFSERVLSVFFVGFRDGLVLHYLSEAPTDLSELIGRTCELRLEKTRRMKHARLHTAGHLIAGIIDAERGGMRAVKGYHFEEGPYVEFEGEPESDAESLLATLQTKINLSIADDMPVTASMVSYDELKMRTWALPSNLPQDKPLRTVTIKTFDPVPCGGTHLDSLSELGTVSVLKMKKRKGTTKISYQVGDLQ